MTLFASPVQVQGIQGHVHETHRFAMEGKKRRLIYPASACHDREGQG
jgi:hypothetical protein